MKFLGKVGNGTINKWLNFGGDADHRLDTGTVFRIRHYCEIRKVVSTDCAARRRHRRSNYDVITSPADNRQPRQTCLGGGMHCPSASSFCVFADCHTFSLYLWVLYRQNIVRRANSRYLDYSEVNFVFFAPHGLHVALPRLKFSMEEFSSMTNFTLIITRVRYQTPKLNFTKFGDTHQLRESYEIFRIFGQISK